MHVAPLKKYIPDDGADKVAIKLMFTTPIIGGKQPNAQAARLGLENFNQWSNEYFKGILKGQQVPTPRPEDGVSILEGNLPCTLSIWSSTSNSLY